MRRPRPDRQPRVARAGWSSGARRKRMFSGEPDTGRGDRAGTSEPPAAPNSATPYDANPYNHDPYNDGSYDDTPYDDTPYDDGAYRDGYATGHEASYPRGYQRTRQYGYDRHPAGHDPTARRDHHTDPGRDDYRDYRDGYADPGRDDYRDYDDYRDATRRHRNSPPDEPAPDDGNATRRTSANPGPPPGEARSTARGSSGPPPPRKLTVTRVAAWRGRQLTGQGIRAFQRAAGADGADRSGLKALTYASMMDYATDASIAVALANTLFFSAATAESKTKVALYLLITVAPFALVAPVVGPLLDRVQRGRRAALALSFAGRGVMAVLMAFHFNDWGLYPAALGAMVLSKSFTVLRAAVTPRVLPQAITLVTTNSRLTVFGLVAGAVFGAGATGFAKVTGSPGALWYTAALCLLGAWLCLRIPGWVEVTSGEVPASLREGRDSARRQSMGHRVVVTLWANGAIRVLTGFLMLFVAFVIKAQTEHDPTRQVLLLGVVGAAAGIGSILGNAIGSKQHFGRPDVLVLSCVATCVAAAASVALLPGELTAAVCALVAATASALAKVCLDAVIQRDLPERSRASAFGRSETVLQLCWVFGGALGVLLPAVYWIGFTTVASVVALGGLQALLLSRGRSLLPFLHPRPTL